MKSMIISTDPVGVTYSVTDEDRTWRVKDPNSLPPNFLEYDAIQEVLHVISIATHANAPTWVVERLKKYLQTLR